MQQNKQRVFFRRVKIRRPDQHGLDARALRSLEPKGFRLVHFERRQYGFILARDLPHSASIARRRKNLRRHRQAGALEDQCFAVPAQRDSRVVAACDQLSWRSPHARSHLIYGHQSFVFCREVESLAIRRPEQFVRAVVESFRQVLDFARRTVVEHDSPAVGLVPRRQLRVVRDVFAIGRINRLAVEALLRCDPFRFAALNRHGKQVRVRADGLNGIGHSREADLLRIRRKIEVTGSASLIRWHVVIRARRQIARSRATIGRHDKQVTAFPVAPMRPVPVKKVFRDMRFHLVLFFRFIPCFVARIVFTIRVHPRGERDRFTIRRPFHDVRARRNLRELFRLSSLHR